MTSALISYRTVLLCDFITVRITSHLLKTQLKKSALAQRSLTLHALPPEKIELWEYARSEFNRHVSIFSSTSLLCPLDDRALHVFFYKQEYAKISRVTTLTYNRWTAFSFFRLVLCNVLFRKRRLQRSLLRFLQLRTRAEHKFSSIWFW